MVKKSIVERNKKRKLLSECYYKKRNDLRVLKKKKDLSFQERLDVYRKINKLKRDTSHIRVRNRCNVTGRGRGYYRMFGLSRSTLRQLCSHGYISGVKKLSW